MRALHVLEVLNRKTASSLGELHAATGLPKPTLVRMLDTLIAAGYAMRISFQLETLRSEIQHLRPSR